jgi:RES domain
MSQSIWTRCAESSRLRPLALDAWRVVESQFITSTRKLVDSDDEQELLERMVEAVKPPVPPDPRLQRLHFLLYTPFRYPPLVRGSRFGTLTERGIWYGSLLLPTAFAEVAYYRLVFLDGTAAPLEIVTVELSAFRAAVRTRRGVDLTAPPFAQYAARISSKTSYGSSQPLGTEMRASGVEVAIYGSARDRAGGKNVALFAPAFVRRSPAALSTWVCTATRQRVEIAKKDILRKQRHAFDRADFEIGGALPTPAL